MTVETGGQIVLQTMVIASSTAWFVLIIAALTRLQHQSLSEYELLLWRLFAVCVPVVGVIAVFVFFPRGKRKR